jgi:hypothetical protein
MTSIVGVHGVGQYVPERNPAETAAKIASVWSAAAAKGTGLGSTDIDLSVAYYAHHLRTGTGHGDEEPESLDGEACEMLYHWAVELAGSESIPHGMLLGPARDIISGMASGPYRGLPLQAFATIFTHEVQLYLGKRYGDRRVRARDEVARQIRERGASIVLAHSLGSVVAYEALHAHPDLEIDLLVTMGSPLAIRRTVFDRLQPKPARSAGRAHRPPGVRRWANFADPGDICAVPRWLSRYFDIDEDHETPIGVFAYHKAAAYLACEKLGTLLRESSK